MEQYAILNLLHKYRSIWELLYDVPIECKFCMWTNILDNLMELFRKNTFYNLIGNEKYYPQPTENCRYYIKPNNGSFGRGIKLVNSLNNITNIDDHIICPEIITPCITIDEKQYKYDYRVWIGIKSDLSYFICPTFIKRISNIPFDITITDGSITNTCLYSDQFDYQDYYLYKKVNTIVHDVIKKLTTKNENKVMLTGWDFIENQNNELFVLEVNPNPSINFQHLNVMTEFLNWINIQ